MPIPNNRQQRTAKRGAIPFSLTAKELIACRSLIATKRLTAVEREQMRFWLAMHAGKNRGISRQRISKARTKFGRPSDRKARLTGLKRQVQERLSPRQRGVLLKAAPSRTVKQLASQFEITSAAVWKILKKFRVVALPVSTGRTLKSLLARISVDKELSVGVAGMHFNHRNTMVILAIRNWPESRRYGLRTFTNAIGIQWNPGFAFDTDVGALLQRIEFAQQRDYEPQSDRARMDSAAAFVAKTREAFPAPDWKLLMFMCDNLRENDGTLVSAKGVKRNFKEIDSVIMSPNGPLDEMGAFLCRTRMKQNTLGVLADRFLASGVLSTDRSDEDEKSSYSLKVAATFISSPEKVAHCIRLQIMAQNYTAMEGWIGQLSVRTTAFPRNHDGFVLRTLEWPAGVSKNLKNQTCITPLLGKYFIRPEIPTPRFLSDLRHALVKSKAATRIVVSNGSLSVVGPTDDVFCEVQPHGVSGIEPRLVPRTDVFGEPELAAGALWRLAESDIGQVLYGEEIRRKFGTATRVPHLRIRRVDYHQPVPLGTISKAEWRADEAKPKDERRWIFAPEEGPLMAKETATVPLLCMESRLLDVALWCAVHQGDYKDMFVRIGNWERSAIDGYFDGNREGAELAPYIRLFSTTPPTFHFKRNEKRSQGNRVVRMLLSQCDYEVAISGLLADERFHLEVEAGYWVRAVQTVLQKALDRTVRDERTLLQKMIRYLPVEYYNAARVNEALVLEILNLAQRAFADGHKRIHRQIYENMSRMATGYPHHWEPIHAVTERRLLAQFWSFSARFVSRNLIKRLRVMGVVVKKDPEDDYSCQVENTRGNESESEYEREHRFNAEDQMDSDSSFVEVRELIASLVRFTGKRGHEPIWEEFRDAIRDTSDYYWNEIVATIDSEGFQRLFGDYCRDVKSMVAPKALVGAQAELTQWFLRNRVHFDQIGALG